MSIDRCLIHDRQNCVEEMCQSGGKQSEEMAEAHLEFERNKVLKLEKRATLLDEAVRICDRHALFLKYEIEHGGDERYLRARQDEAEYLAGKIRALAVGLR